MRTENRERIAVLAGGHRRYRAFHCGPDETRLFRDRGALDVVHLRERFVQVRVTLAHETAQIEILAFVNFSVAAIELVDDVHPGSDFAERRKSRLLIKA